MLSKLLIGVIIAMALAGVWMKFQLDALTIANINLTTERDAAVATAENLETTIQVQAEQIAASAEKMRELDAARVEAQRQVQYVQTLFADHDFARLLAAKPGLIEKRMVAKTAEVLRELEMVTQ